MHAVQTLSFPEGCHLGDTEEGPRGKEDQGPSSWGDRHEAKYMETLENALRGHTIVMTMTIY